jgi:hypothetical protein
MTQPDVLWDVDFDFFLDSERTILEDQDKSYWLTPDVLLNAHSRCRARQLSTIVTACASGTRPTCGVGSASTSNAHPDLFDEADPGLKNLPLGRRGDCVTDGNYLLIALRDGILAHLVWVLPDWQAMDDYRARFFQCNPELTDKVEMLRYRDFLGSKVVQWIPQRIEGAFSPGFTPLHMVRDFVEWFGADEILIDSIVEAALAVRFRMEITDSLGSMTHRTVSIMESNATLYHGTSLGGLVTLIPAMHGQVYASSSPVSLPASLSALMIHKAGYKVLIT